MVIAILSILITLLFPVFAHVRERARQTHCLGNMKQIGTALNAYLQDWDETFPASRFPDATHPGKPTPFGGLDDLEGSSYNWRRALWSTGLLKTPEVYRCPSNDTAWMKMFNDCEGDESNCAPENKDRPDRQLPNSYGLNKSHFWEILGVHALADIKEPSRLIFLLESRGRDLDLHYLCIWWSCSRDGERSFQLHGNRSNWMFADTHVKSLKLLQTIVPQQGRLDPSQMEAPNEEREFQESLLKLYEDGVKQWPEYK